MKQVLSPPCSIGRGLATRRLQNPGIVRKGDFLLEMTQNGYSFPRVLMNPQKQIFFAEISYHPPPISEYLLILFQTLS